MFMGVVDEIKFAFNQEEKRNIISCSVCKKDMKLITAMIYVNILSYFV